MAKMNTIEQLIAEHSPQGVEYKELGDVNYFNLIMGQSPKGEFISSNRNGLEFHQGKSYFTNCVIANSHKYTSKIIKTIEANNVIMSVRAPVGAINYTDRKICIGRGLCGIQSTKKVISKYLFYVMQIHGKIISNKSFGSIFLSVNFNDIKKHKIPIPPLDIQKEIVKMLDNFTELEAELEARKKQYEYYRHKLLTFKPLEYQNVNKS